MEAITNMQDDAQFPTAAILKPVGKLGPGEDLSTEETAEIDRACRIAASPEAHAQASDDIINCVDDRYDENGDVLGAQSAGGAVGIAAARALIGDVMPGEKSDAHTARTDQELLAKGKKIGGHTAAAHGDHPELKSGCGASDSEDDILVYIAAYSGTLFDVLQPILAGRGIELTRELSDRIGLQAQELHDGRYAENNGRANIEVVEQAGGVMSDYGHQKHEAVGAMLSFAHEVFDKAAFRKLLGRDDLKMFNADVWAMEAAGKTLYPDDPVKAHEFLIACIYFNVGTYAVLGNANVRFVVYDGHEAGKTAA